MSDIDRIAEVLTKPCRCWYGPVGLSHTSEHCCFDGVDIDTYTPGKPLPCGHCVHEYVGGVCRMCGEAADG